MSLCLFARGSSLSNYEIASYETGIYQLDDLLQEDRYYQVQALLQRYFCEERDDVEAYTDVVGFKADILNLAYEIVRILDVTGTRWSSEAVFR